MTTMEDFVNAVRIIAARGGSEAAQRFQVSKLLTRYVANAEYRKTAPCGSWSATCALSFASRRTTRRPAERACCWSQRTTRSQAGFGRTRSSALRHRLSNGVGLSGRTRGKQWKYWLREERAGVSIMVSRRDDPILIVCTACTNRIERTYSSLRDNQTLECPACGADMANERAAVVEHNETIGRIISSAWPGSRY